MVGNQESLVTKKTILASSKVQGGSSADKVTSKGGSAVDLRGAQKDNVLTRKIRETRGSTSPVRGG